MSRRLFAILAALFLLGAASVGQPPERPKDNVPPKRPSEGVGSKPVDGPLAKPKDNSGTKPKDTAPARPGDGQTKPKDDGPKPPRPSSEDVPGLGPVGPIVKVQTGFSFTEGPATDRDGSLYFSDVSASKIYKLDAEGKHRAVVEKSNRANGLAINAKGEIVACEGGAGGAPAIAVYSPDGAKRTVLVDKHADKQLNGPNDLVLDSAGGIYFTDPLFARPDPAKQDKEGVYYVPPGGAAYRIVDDTPRPNGVILSPDEKTLYLVSSAKPAVTAYTVTAPGKISAGRIFCTLQKSGRASAGGGDGVAVDEKGNLYVASQLGVQVFSPAGKLLGVIRLAEVPSNVEFGGKDFKTLYATARTSLYAIPMSVKGYRFPGGRP